MAIQKIIVCGSPNSGKTTLSIQLAAMIEKKYKQSVVGVFAQEKGSPATYAFYKKAEDGKSLGELITSPKITEDDICESLLLPKSKNDVAFLGYRLAETFENYPKLNMDEIDYFFKVLGRVADYIIVDGTNDIEDNPLTRYALERFDTVIYVGGGDVQSLSYYKSVLPIINNITGRGIDMLLLNDVKAYNGIETVEEQMGSVNYVLPYEIKLLEQNLEGRMIDEITINKRKQNYAYVLSQVMEDLIVTVE